MKRNFTLLLAIALWAVSCRTYDITSLIIQDDLQRQIASGNLRIKIEKEHIPYVVDLLLDEDPLIRYAALKIIDRNHHEEFLYPLLETTLDEDDRVSSEAFRMLVDSPEWTQEFLERELDKMGDLLCLKSLDVLVLLDRETSLQAMVNLFTVNSEKKKDGAARALSQLIVLDSDLMGQLKNSDDPSFRAGYYRIVGHYQEETLIPLLFQGISDGNTLVWGACVSGIYRFGEGSFPFVERYIQTDDYLMVLSCLQILEAVKSAESLPLLISMYGDANQLLAQKAAIIVKSYGYQAIPHLQTSFGSDNLRENRLILWTLREINSIESLQFYLELLEQRDPELEQDILLSLSFLGPEIFPQLRDSIHRASPEVAASLLEILIKGGDDLVVTDNICSYYLISSVGDEAFDTYFTHTQVRSEIKEDFYNLRRARTLGGLLREDNGEVNKYFLFYRDLLLLRSQAGEALELSMALRRSYLQTRDQEKRTQSDLFFSQYESYTEQAQEKEDYMKNLPNSIQRRGETLIYEYLEARQEIVDIWVGISPRFRPLAELIYGDMDKDISLLLEEVSQ